MREKVLKKIVISGSKISVLVDESTSLSNKSALVVYLRVVIEDIVETIFLDLVELQGTTAIDIYDELLRCMKAHGFTQEYLFENWVSFACDGASVMLGRCAGVAALILRDFPQVFVWHCAAHRLELAVNDAVEEVGGVNNFRAFMDKLYSLYHQSPKNQRQLHDVSESFGTQLLSIGRVLNTRWVASSARPDAAVWQNYPALFEHFSQAASDPTRSKSEQVTYQGLANRMSTQTFVKNLALMYDALEELADISRHLQRRDINVLEANRLIAREVVVLKAFQDGKGPHMQKVLEKSSCFMGVPLYQGRKSDVEINANKFFLYLAEKLEDRLLTSNKGFPSSSELLEHFKALHPTYWPDSVNICHGDHAVRYLCSHFNLSSSNCLKGMREYIENGGKRVPQDLKPLLLIMDSIPVSTAECERGFSAMNLILTSSRSAIQISRVSQLMMIRLVGPPLALWDPIPYVHS